MAFMVVAGMSLGIYIYQRYVVKEFDAHRKEMEALMEVQKERSRHNLAAVRELHRKERDEEAKLHRADMMIILERHKLDIEKLEQRLFMIDEELKQCLKHRASGGRG